jgi:hypothetical protein
MILAVWRVSSHAPASRAGGPPIRPAVVVPLLPHVEQSGLHDSIMASGKRPDLHATAGSPAFGTELADVRCPSDSSTPKLTTEPGRSNYLLSAGDKLVQLGCEEGAVCASSGSTPIGVSRALFGVNSQVQFKDVTDGLSKTLALAECALVNLQDVSGVRRVVNDRWGGRLARRHGAPS